MGIDYELVAPKYKRVLECGKSGWELTQLSRVRTWLKPHIIELGEKDMQAYLKREQVEYLDHTLLEDDCILQEIYQEWNWPIADRIWAWLQELPELDPDLYVVGDTTDACWVWKTLDRKIAWPRPQAGWLVDSVYNRHQQELFEKGFTVLSPWEEK